MRKKNYPPNKPSVLFSTETSTGDKVRGRRGGNRQAKAEVSLSKTSAYWVEGGHNRFFSSALFSKKSQTFCSISLKCAQSIGNLGPFTGSTNVGKDQKSKQRKSPQTRFSCTKPRVSDLGRKCSRKRRVGSNWVELGRNVACGCFGV